MLPPDSRQTLLRGLAPPPGAMIKHLVGTTFTLDLESALLPALALSGSIDVDGSDTIETVAAIRASIGLVDIFHQAGHIAVPPRRTPLFALLEGAIHTVVPERGLFHPKVWVAEYRGENDEQLLRLIVLSRNLTRDRSWDLVLLLDGHVGEVQDPGNTPIAHLLRYLAEHMRERAAVARRRRVLDLAEAIQYARWDLPPGATDMTFHVLGVPGRRSTRPDLMGTRHLVVSPFLTDNGIRLASVGSGHLTVVSRQESLDALSEESAEWIDSAFVLASNASIPDEDDERAAGASVLSGLHAKLYSVEYGQRARLFVGSANATGAGLRANVEILVELNGPKSAFGVAALLGESGFGSILETADISPDSVATDDDAERALDDYIRGFCSIPLTACLESSGDTASITASSEVQLPSADPGVVIGLSPLAAPSATVDLVPGELVVASFDALALQDVGAFFVLEVRDPGGRSRRTVVKAELLNDDPRRHDAIVTAQLDGSDAFRRLLELLLAFGLPAGGDPEDNGDAGPGTASWATVDQGLFELILRASVSSAGGLEKLAGVVSSIIAQGDPHNVLPDGFRELWAAVAEAKGLDGTDDLPDGAGND